MTSRSRSSGALTSITYNDHWFSSDKVACTGSLVRTDRGPIACVDYVGELRSMTDEVVPNFRKRSAQGEVIINAMSSSKVTLNKAVFGLPLVFTGSGYQCSGSQQYQSIYELPTQYPLVANGSKFQPVASTWTSPPLLSNGEIENAIDEASTHCQSERGRSPVNFWETIAERKQTYALLASYAEAAKLQSRAIGNFVNSNQKFPKKLLRTTSYATNAACSAWLVSRYGLLPLMKDIQSLMTQLRASQDDAERHTTRGKAVVERAVVNQILNPLTHVTEVGHELLTDSLVVRAMSLDEWRFTILDHFGLGSKDLVTLPWELLTLSFVADWFVNAGKFIGALVPTPGVNQLGSCIAYTRTRSRTVNITGYTPNGIAAVTSPATMSKTGVKVEKVRFPGLRVPKLIVLNRARTSLALDKNQLRFADACALIGQRLAAHAGHIASKLPRQ